MRLIKKDELAMAALNVNSYHNIFLPTRLYFRIFIMLKKVTNKKEETNKSHIHGFPMMCELDKRERFCAARALGW